MKQLSKYISCCKSVSGCLEILLWYFPALWSQSINKSVEAFESPAEADLPRHATGNSFRPCQYRADYHTAREHRQVRPTKYQDSFSQRLSENLFLHSETARMEIEVLFSCFYQLILRFLPNTCDWDPWRGEPQCLKLITVMIGDGGRGRYMLRHGRQLCSWRLWSNERVVLAVRTSSCSLLKGPATDPIHPNSRCHIKSRLTHMHAHSHMFSTDTHRITERCARLHTDTHTQMSDCLRVRGDLELLTENKEENQEEKTQPLRINLTTMLRKIPNLTPETQEKPCFFLSKQSKVSYKSRNRKHFR